MRSPLTRIWSRLIGRGRAVERRVESVRLDDAEAPAPYAIAERLDHFVHPNERRRAEVWRRHDGFFGFGEEELLDDEYAGPYWSPARGSGLYATHEDALRDAKAEIAWIRNSLT